MTDQSRSDVPCRRLALCGGGGWQGNLGQENGAGAARFLAMPLLNRGASGRGD